MSAFIVSRTHIAYLVEAATSRRLAEGHDFALHWYWRDGAELHHAELRVADYKRAAEVGQMLWDENIKSIIARYPNCEGHPENYPGPAEENFRYDVHSFPAGRLSIEPVQVLKACNCYAYQSCEHEGWEASEAKAFVDALRAKAIRALPGYAEAAWEIPSVLPAPAAPQAAAPDRPRRGGASDGSLSASLAPGAPEESAPRHGWRNHHTHREESAAVKRALQGAGIKARVGHGTGTAWGWLKVTVCGLAEYGSHQKTPDDFCQADCPRCKASRALEERARAIIRQATGRRGEYGGNVSVTCTD